MSFSILLPFAFTLEAVCACTDEWWVWQEAFLPDIPFERSTDILDMEYAPSCVAAYESADTWFASWSEEGDLWSPWTDGIVNGVESHSYDDWKPGWIASTGVAHIHGDDPFALVIDHANITRAWAAPYAGRYPCGSLAYQGVWYYGTYMLDEIASSDCGNWCQLGPLVGYKTSLDKGHTWDEPRYRLMNDSDTLFGESSKQGGIIRFGAPHVVDFGRNMQHSPDGKMYIVGHGSITTNATANWMNGDAVYMARVLPSIETINDRSQWEFYAGAVGGEAVWTPGNVSEAQPLFVWPQRTGCVTMTYVPALGRYLVVVGTPRRPPSTIGTFDLYLLESRNLTGPFRLVTYWESFGPQGYFAHFPSKFVAAEVHNSYLELFLSYSANFETPIMAFPPRSGYHLTLLKLRLFLRD